MRLLTNMARGLVVLALGVITGCSGPELVATGPYSTADKTAPLKGLRYYLPMDEVEINATVTAKTQSKVTEDLTVQQIAEQTSTATVGLTTVADTSQYFVLDLQPAGFKDQTLGISVGPDGLLTSVTYNSTDRLAETITNIAKATADVAGTFVGAAARVPGPDKIEQVFKRTALGKQLDDARNAGNAPPSVAKGYTNALNAFRSNPLLTIYALDQSVAAMQLWDTRIALDVKLTQLTVSRQDLLSKADTSSKDQLDLINAQATALSSAITSAQDRRDKAQVAFQAFVDQYAVDHHLDPATPQVANINAVLTVDDLPSTSDLPADLSQIIQKLTASNAAIPLPNITPHAWGVLLQTGILVTADPVGSKLDHQSDAAASGKVARLAYRPTVPILLSTYTLKLGPTATKSDSSFLRTDQRIVYVIRQDAPTLHVDYDRKAFSNQSLSLTFSQGRLTGINQGATAAVANAAAGIAGAIDTGLSTYSAALTQEQNNQKTLQAIVANRLASQLNTVQQRKAILDAQLAYQGENADANLILQKQQTDQQLATLQSQVAAQSEAVNAPLIVQQSNATQQLSALQAQQGLTNYQSTYQIAVQQALVQSQVGLLTQQVNLLTQQISALTQQNALKKASSP
jgi:hypothetical protein